MSYFSFDPELSILVFSSLYAAYQFLSQFLITQVLTSRRRSEVSADVCTVLGSSSTSGFVAVADTDYLSFLGV
ncbi:MAG: hypothetical protein V7K97_07770 [Nostoc sp.]|uniref:hypothetical protein n=1 Tax=Nostoc sp. TaxID=1180 RepID=UPI002FFBBDC8